MSLFVHSCSLCVAHCGSFRLPFLPFLPSAMELSRKPWNLCSLLNLEFWQQIGFKAWVLSHLAKGMCCIYHACSITNTPSGLQYSNWQVPILQYIPLMEKQISHHAKQHKAVKARSWVDTGSRPTCTDLFFQRYFCGDVATTVQMLYSQWPSPARHYTSSSKTCQPGSFKTPRGRSSVWIFKTGCLKFVLSPIHREWHRLC